MNPFKKTSHCDEAAETYLRTSQLLLQAIGLHVVEGEPQEYDSFRATIKDLQAKLGGHAPVAEGLAAASVAAKAMQDYGRRTTQFIKAENIELVAMIETLIETVLHLGAPNGRSIPLLRELGASLPKASSINDIRTLKIRLAECLEGVRREAAEQRRRAVMPPREIPSGEKETSASQPDPSDENPQQLDPVTNLPMRPDAESAIRESMQDSRAAFAVTFVVDRIYSINGRFGSSVGDQVLQSFVERLRKGLTATDRIFRWAEASFIALLERTEDEPEVRRQIERILFRRFEEIFAVGSRSVLLPISATWGIVPLSEATSEVIIRKIDASLKQPTR